MQSTTTFNIRTWISFFLINFMMTLGGCANTDKKSQLFGQTMPTLQEVYQNKLQQKPFSDRQYKQRGIHDTDGDLTGGLHQTYDDIRQQFPLLPNPVLLLYVYPHLTTAGTPVPGYYTAFTFYTQDQFALPGETTVPEHEEAKPQ